MGWLPFVDDPDVTDPRYDESWVHLYDGLGDKILWDNTTYKQLAFFLSGLPVVGDIGIMADSFRSFNDYMRNTGLTWDDVMYPWLTGRRFGVSSSGYGALNFVSSNIARLYRNRRGFPYGGLGGCIPPVNLLPLFSIPDFPWFQ